MKPSESPQGEIPRIHNMDWLDLAYIYSLILWIMAMRPQSLRSLPLEQTLTDRFRQSILNADSDGMKAVFKDSRDYTDALKKWGDIQGAVEAQTRFREVYNQAFEELKKAHPEIS